jgi:predicted DNA-binding ribbon-helix-helix protein
VRVGRRVRLVMDGYETEANRGYIAYQHKDTLMKSPIVKRSIVIAGRKTSVTLEDAFWRGLKDIAHIERVTLSNMVGEIDKARSQSNLSSAIRLFVLDRLRSRTPHLAPDGHDRFPAQQMARHRELTHA